MGAGDNAPVPAARSTGPSIWASQRNGNDDELLLESANRPLGFALLERLPPAIFYLPIAMRILWQAMRHGSLSLPTIANPAIENGGMCGWSKSEQFALMSLEGRRWMAPQVAIASLPNRPEETVQIALSKMAEAQLAFPLVAKPDRGKQGMGVQLIRDEAHLDAYVQAFPSGEILLLQKLVSFPNEAGILYVRRPSESSGTVVSCALKFAAEVVGDGVLRLEELIRAKPCSAAQLQMRLAAHHRFLNRIPDKGERIPLLFARNHRTGAVCRDAADLVTPALAHRIDQLAKTVPAFYIGRFDIRFGSVAGLRAGRDFLVIELNGVGSEPLHVWDPGYGVLNTYRQFFDQIDRIFTVAAENRAMGHTPIGSVDLWRRWRQQLRVKRNYPPTH